MRVSKEAKADSNGRIVKNAARMLRERGIENTSVGEVMSAAGLTHGGFYRHFASKDELLQAGVRAAFDEATHEMEKVLKRAESGQGIEAHRRYYLSSRHIQRPGMGCPLAALSGDVARASETVKSEFGVGLKRSANLLSTANEGTSAEPQAIRELAMLVGAVMMARASDPQTAEAVLKACLEAPLKQRGNH